MNIEIKADFPIEWDKKYYAIDSYWSIKCEPNKICDGKFIFGRTLEEKRVYYVVELRLSSIHVNAKGKVNINFKDVNRNRFIGAASIRNSKIGKVKSLRNRGEAGALYADYYEALEEAEKLNKSEGDATI